MKLKTNRTNNTTARSSHEMKTEGGQGLHGQVTTLQTTTADTEGNPDTTSRPFSLPGALEDWEKLYRRSWLSVVREV